VTVLPNTNGIDTADERYDRCVRSYNIAVSRYNSAADYLESAEREYADAERWYAEARDDLNRAAAATGAPGAP
jgi:exonuclease VII small subunit